METMMTDERSLAEVLGIDRAVLRILRSGGKLEYGRHWDRGHGGRIEYTEDGVKVVQEILATTPPENMAEKAPPPPDEGEEPAGVEIAPPATSSEATAPLQDVELEYVRRPEPFNAKVLRIPMNKRVLIAEHEGRQVVVRVRQNTLFHVGMALPIIPDGSAYRLGCKNPRHKGRW
jgi:hypothetical protein